MTKHKNASERIEAARASERKYERSAKGKLTRKRRQVSQVRKDQMKRNRRSQQLRDFAYAGGSLPSIAKQIRKGGDLFSVDKSGCSPLHLAALGGHVQACKLILLAMKKRLSHKGEPMVELFLSGLEKECSGDTDLDWRRGFERSRGDYNDHTPEQIAQEEGHPVVVRVLQLAKEGGDFLGDSKEAFEALLSTEAPPSKCLNCGGALAGYGAGYCARGCYAYEGSSLKSSVGRRHRNLAEYSRVEAAKAYGGGEQKRHKRLSDFSDECASRADLAMQDYTADLARQTLTVAAVNHRRRKKYRSDFRKNDRCSDLSGCSCARGASAAPAHKRESLMVACSDKSHLGRPWAAATPVLQWVAVIMVSSLSLISCVQSYNLN